MIENLDGVRRENPVNSTSVCKATSDATISPGGTRIDQSNGKRENTSIIYRVGKQSNSTLMFNIVTPPSSMNYVPNILVGNFTIDAGSTNRGTQKGAIKN